MAAVNNNRVYSYLNSDNYSFLNSLKNRIKYDGYNVSCSKIIRLAVIELKDNNSYDDIKQKMIQNEMI